MNLLAFFAHPDDETMLIGGVLALLALSGEHVHYLCATRGEGGELGEPPLCDPAELGKVRAEELSRAVSELGGASLSFLGYTDPGVGPGEELYPFTTNLAQLSARIVAVIKEYNITAVITHGSNGEYGHPAHILCHRGARLAVSSLKSEGVRLYSVAATFPGHPRPRVANQDDPAHLVLPINPALRWKIRAALCHRTQHALFVRRASRNAGRPMKVPEIPLRIESLHRHIPREDEQETDGLFQLLQPWMVESKG